METVGYWVSVVARLLDERFDDALPHAGLGRRHWHVLTLLAGGAAQSEAADGVLHGFETEVQDLAARGWVQRAPEGWAITAEGQTAYHRLLDDVTAARERVTEGIDPADVATAVDVLRRVAQNLRPDA
ncbi:MarR family winged helix-turn-helix transcriptional regulator [Luteimicrobium sp. DT211]|uniref:MarR family winged helix-turn-helix transcriptional regulator n=1 Tax=Luteimicrobium sp. DT211 TaxID=3393412 RepID=UPI003CF2AAA7